MFALDPEDETFSLCQKFEDSQATVDDNPLIRSGDFSTRKTIIQHVVHTDFSCIFRKVKAALFKQNYYLHLEFLNAINMTYILCPLLTKKNSLVQVSCIFFESYVARFDVI